MAKYVVLKDGISQREGDRIVERAVGAEIEVSDVAAPELVEAGYLRAVKSGRSKRG
jgi:hypothetical protein